MITRLSPLPLIDNPYHEQKPWDRPLTVRQRYWFECVQFAVARKPAQYAADGKPWPVSLLDVRRVDREHNDGRDSIQANVVAQTLNALVVRRWLDHVDLGPLRPSDGRCSALGYALADRARLEANHAAIELMLKKIARAEANVRSLAGLVGDGGTMHDEVKLRDARKKHKELMLEMGALRIAANTIPLERTTLRLSDALLALNDKPRIGGDTRTIDPYAE